MAASKIKPHCSRIVSQRVFVLGAWLAFVSTTIAAAPTTKAAAAPLGSTKFAPSSDHPIGWRGDGTGRYPGATPPTSWERTTNGNGYATKGVVWMAPLPNLSTATPIIVGEKIFLTSEVSDLLCLDKQTGKVLWIRSNPEFEALSDEDRKTNSAYADKLTPLAAELAKANTEAVEALNARMPSAKTVTPRTLEPVLKRKRDLEKQIETQQLAIDKKLFARYWGQARPRLRRQVSGGEIRQSSGMTRGIFVTTSSFQSGAQRTADRLRERGCAIELMDAPRFYDALKLAQRERYKFKDESATPYLNVPLVYFGGMVA